MRSVNEGPLEPRNPRLNGDDDYPGSGRVPTPASPRPSAPPPPPPPPQNGGWQGKPNPDGSHNAPPAGAQPTTPANPSTTANNNADIDKLKAQHKIDHQFQMDMMELQMGFQRDQFWVTTLSTINKANHDTKSEVGRKFG
jgi:hypothetical protein